MSISPEGTTRSSDIDLTAVAWSGIERVIKNKDHVFVYTSALTAIIVPRRAFADAVGFGELVLQAAGFHEKAEAVALPNS